MLEMLHSLIHELHDRVAVLPIFGPMGNSEESDLLVSEFSGKKVRDCDWNYFLKDPDLVGFIWEEDVEYFLPKLLELSKTNMEVLVRLVYKLRQSHTSPDFHRALRDAIGDDGESIIRKIEEIYAKLYS